MLWCLQVRIHISSTFNIWYLNGTFRWKNKNQNRHLFNNFCEFEKLMKFEQLLNTVTYLTSFYCGSYCTTLIFYQNRFSTELISLQLQCSVVVFTCDPTFIYVCLLVDRVKLIVYYICLYFIELLNFPSNNKFVFSTNKIKCIYLYQMSMTIVK